MTCRTFYPATVDCADVICPDWKITDLELHIHCRTLWHALCEMEIHAEVAVSPGCDILFKPKNWPPYTYCVVFCFYLTIFVM